MKKLVLFISILILFSFAGCGQNKGTDKTANDKSVNTGTSTSTLKSSSSTSATNVAEITTSKSDDGKKLGYITKLYEKNGSKYLDIDYIDWLTGEAAIKAIMEDYKVSRNEAEEMYTDDYYIRNQSTELRTFKISDDAVYTEIKDNPEGVKSDFDDMKKKVESSNIKVLCYITLKSNKVIDIQQQYQP